MRRRRHQFHFSLLELVMVLAVMGAILAVTAPSLAGFVHGRSVREESRRLVATTRRAASAASALSSRTRLWLDSETGSYGWQLFETFSPDEAEGMAFTVADGIVLEIEPQPASGLHELVFRPDGGVEGADSTFLVRFVSGGNREASEVRFLVERGVFAVVGEVPEDEE